MERLGMPTRRTVGALTLLGAMGVGAFVATTYSAQSQPLKVKPVAAAIPFMTSINNASFPLDAYKETPEQLAAMTNAMRSAVSSCMESFGFPGYPKAKTGPIKDPFPKDRRYLFIDPSAAAQYGYDGMANISAIGGEKSKRREMTPQEQTAFTGNGEQVVNDKRVPDGGCIGQARQKIQGSAGLGAEENLPARLEGEAYRQAESDGRVLAVNSAWSSCMQSSGYSYTSPEQAWEDPKWREHRDGGPLTTTERTVAAADMNCKVKVNYLGVRFAVESEYQQKAVTANADGLNTFKGKIQAQVKNANTIMAE